MKRLYIGTAGWQYPEWKHSFYPRGMPTSQFLTYYSEIFDAVELNSSYYRLPRPETIIEWKMRTPSDFKICPRLIQAITFKNKLKKGDNLLKAFLDHFLPLEERLGPVVIEIPENIYFTDENVEPFLDMLGRFSHHYTFVIEPRHVSWMDPNAGKMCEERELTWSISDFCGRIPTIHKTIGSKIYLRFHGTHDLKNSEYTVDTLQYCAAKVQHWLEEGKTVYVFFNNHFGGFALENAKEFKKLIQVPH
ncbi:DUF72 domain-containing protein [Waddlia chondrophila]|uniref:DUF72 domain-containing protein n=1 Tax=Waddlia chondrophila (strain ATCC VR-1470 / WSU 86-1044) TaxID=716544 RepID=D6YTR4_WADCW|nr:DUF72 domain-containing protein [Waddlia chondrophila]ADI37525.1 hypothetical protein wcw_0150 [Waddlia chondrophila WSU 86-1044]